VGLKVIAGESLEAKTTIGTQTAIMYLHFTLQPSAIAVQPVPREYNITIGCATYRWRTTQRTSCSLWSFVMNTEAEIVQAIEDYRNGRMGSIDF
jgi:hypothetical protein